MTLAEPAEPNDEETTVTHQGRWRRTKSTQPPAPAKYQVADSPSAGVDKPLFPSLGYQPSTSTALRQQFHYLFLAAHMPSQVLESKSDMKSAAGVGWLVQLQDVAIQSPALDTSIAAFFASRAGRSNNDMDLVHRSRSMYLCGLERVKRAVDNPRTRCSDETLAACIALSFYELTECPGGAFGAFKTHMQGAMALLQLRGPEGCTSPLGHSSFLFLRAQTVSPFPISKWLLSFNLIVLQIAASLLHHRETFLSQPEWVQGPWKLTPKTFHDKLFDHMFAIPAIHQQSDGLSRETDQTVLQDGHRGVIAKCLKVESELRSLFETFEQSASGPLYWPELSTLESHLDDVRLGKVYPVSFHFAAYSVAQVNTTYWSAMMTIHHQLMYTYNKLAAMEFSTQSAGSTTDDDPESVTVGLVFHSAVPSAMRAREHSDIWKTMARNICQSVEYYLTGWVGPVYLLPLLWGCKSCLESTHEDWSREISWIVDMMGRIMKKFDFPISSVYES